ncbi:phospholipase D family protein [Amphritea sp.]|uniref:phospholipase D family protein n=1 Tax=Amphritea sp. TaxID=1872502 RepID=UPI003A94AB9F
MKFIANRINGVHLRDILPSTKHDIEGVYAAIAYGSRSVNEKEDLIGNCLENKLRLDIWMRYDHTVPVAVPVLKRLLNNHRNNVFCKLIPDYLHAKVIWWKGYGAYIGSANLTDRAWITNIEAGIFLSEDDLQTSGMIIEIEGFFERLQELDVAFPLSEEVILEMEKLEQLRGDTDDKGKSQRKIPEWNGPSFENKQKAHDRRKESFRKEWHETLTTLRNIGSELQDRRPSWVNSETPVEWQVDQFLHAYYYNKVSDGLRKPFEDFYQLNKKNPQSALEDAISWWQATTTPPSKEDLTFNSSAPYIREKLRKENILTISVDEFSRICYDTHATKDHVIKINLATLGRPDLSTLSRDKRIPLFANWLLSQHNKKGWDVRKLLHFVLYEGNDESLWERLYAAAKIDDYSLPHYGLNSLAELVGWARPEVAPPRNGRTSKALRALGYDVRIY